MFFFGETDPGCPSRVGHQGREGQSEHAVPEAGQGRRRVRGSGPGGRRRQANGVEGQDFRGEK